MFHYFTLAEVYEYAARMGYDREAVEITYDEYDGVYMVEFGREYTEAWYWEFESLEAPAVYYEHREWED